MKFSTNGTRIDRAAARRLAAMDYVDVQVSIDGATPRPTTRSAARAVSTRPSRDARARDAGFGRSRSPSSSRGRTPASSTSSRRSPSGFGAQLRLTRLRPSGRGVACWDELRPTAQQNRDLYQLAPRPPRHVLTGDSFFHLSALGEPLDGAEPVRRGPRRVPHRPGRRRLRVPLRDPRRVPRRLRARPAASPGVARRSALRSLRAPGSAGACASCGSWDACRGGCMAAKFFTGLPLDGPDPDCVHGHGARAGADGGPARPETAPRPHGARGHRVGRVVEPTARRGVRSAP